MELFGFGLVQPGSFVVPATSPAGGGFISQPVVIPGVIPGTESNIDFWARATDLSGNESVDSIHVEKRFDLLSPGPPQ